MNKANQDLRIEIKTAGLSLWQIGKAWLNINEVSTVRRFRYELTTEDKEQIRNIIKTLSAENK